MTLFDESTYFNPKNINSFLKENYDLDVSYSKIIGAGSFGKVVKIDLKSGKSYAMKLFFKDFLYSKNNHGSQAPKLRQIVTESIDHIEKNYNDYKNKFIVDIIPSNRKLLSLDRTYLMKYAGSVSVRKEIFENKNFANDNKFQAGIILQNYSSMLKNLHDKGYIFHDVDWQSVFFNKEENKITVTDVDFVSKLEKVNKIVFKCDIFGHQGDNLISRPLFTRYGKMDYMHKEYHFRKIETRKNLVDFSFNSELQSFALMIDIFYNGDTLLRYFSNGVRNKSGVSKFRKLLLGGRELKNNVEYPKERYELIPDNLQSIVRDLIRPTPLKYTANDFISAVNLDYKNIINKVTNIL